MRQHSRLNTLLACALVVVATTITLDGQYSLTVNQDRLINAQNETIGNIRASPTPKGRIPDFPVTRSHPLASWPSAANSSICRTYRKSAGEESLRRSPVASR